jgi:hypothetical protein
VGSAAPSVVPPVDASPASQIHFFLSSLDPLARLLHCTPAPAPWRHPRHRTQSQTSSSLSSPKAAAIALIPALVGRAQPPLPCLPRPARATSSPPSSRSSRRLRASSSPPSLRSPWPPPRARPLRCHAPHFDEDFPWTHHFLSAPPHQYFLVPFTLNQSRFLNQSFQRP